MAFKNLRSYQGVLVSAQRSSHGVEWIELSFPKAMQLKIKNTFKVETVCVTQGSVSERITAKDGYFLINGKRGKLKITRN